MLVKIDSAQLEWRTAVLLSGDKVGIDEINSGADIHENNRIAFSLPTRLISKTYLFRTIFRGNGWSFANDPNFSHVSTDPEYWEDINNKFYTKYKGLDAWHHRLKELVIRGQPIVGPTGRFWKIPMKEYQKKNWKTGKLENVLDIPWTTLSNYPVQGTGADIMKVARISLMRRMKTLSLRSVMVSTVHDDLKLDVPDDEVELVCSLATGVFDDLPKNFKKLFNVDLPIPFPGEVSYGYNLLDMKKHEC